MNIVKIDPAIYEFGEVPQEEYLEYFQYKNPVKVEENTYQVDELGASLPAVEILERDVPVPDKEQETVEEEWNPSDLLEQMDAYRQNFEELIAEMGQARQENERRLEQCYVFLKEKGLMEAFEKEYGEVVEVMERRQGLAEAEQASLSKAAEKTPEQKETQEKQEEELQNLEEKKEKIVVPGLAGTWRVVMRLLPGQDKEAFFVLKSETSADQEPVLVDRYAQPVSDTSLEYGLSAYTSVVENYQLAQQIVHLIEKTDPLFGYEEGFSGWENQMQAVGTMEENLASETGREWITGELAHIQLRHPEMEGEIGKIKEKISSLQSLSVQRQPNQNRIEETGPAGKEDSREEADKTKQHKDPEEQRKQEKKTEMTKKKRLGI